ncbi:MAG: zinc ribbon domain-containing protein [Bdellovibrionota bacterium]|nr:zinc ribbon domain-containing protein [Bdellovibrionota bacterium]
MNRQNEREAQKALEKIKTFRNLAGRAEFDTDAPETYKIDIKVDNSVPHGQFLPSKIYPGSWRASEQTYRAMKKDLFALGESVDELVAPYICSSCKTSLDKQFWLFCPYCGESFKDEK